VIAKAGRRARAAGTSGIGASVAGVSGSLSLVASTRLSVSLGQAGASGLTVRQSRGRFAALINSDVTPRPQVNGGRGANEQGAAVVRFVKSSITLRRVGWLLFWSLAAVSALALLLFLWVASPALIAIAQGGSGRVWVFGNAGFFLLAALMYLAVVGHVIIKRRARGSNGDGI